MFNWSDFLKIADLLTRSPTVPGPEEAALRSAISRAYYAAFRSARDFMEYRDKVAPQHWGDDHWLVKEHFRNSQNQIRRDIGSKLMRLKSYRTQADYEAVLRDNALLQRENA